MFGIGGYDSWRQVVMEKKVDAKMRRDGIPDLKRELLMQELPSVLEDSFHEPSLRGMLARMVDARGHARMLRGCAR